MCGHGSRAEFLIGGREFLVTDSIAIIKNSIKLLIFAVSYSPA